MEDILPFPSCVAIEERNIDLGGNREGGGNTERVVGPAALERETE
jgi:hypothetical protein